MKDAEVIIIGSGLAGLSSAFELSKMGKRVLVLEAKEVLGGRAASWVEDGMPVESGLHKFLGIYRALPRLLKQVGVDPDDILTWVDAMELHNEYGQSAHLTSSPYHRPFRTARDYLKNNDFIPARDKLRMLRMGIRGIAQCARKPNQLDQFSIADYARRFGLSEKVIHQVLHTLTSGVLFLPASTFSAFGVFSPIVEGLKKGMTFRIGAFNGGMTEVMMSPIAEAIVQRGGRVLTRTPVTQLLYEKGEIRGVKTLYGRYFSDQVVLATHLRPAQQLIQAAFPNHSWFKGMLSLEPLSVVTFQAELTEPLFETDHTHFSSTQVCCFAEQSHTTFRHVPGRFSSILFPGGKFLYMEPERIRHLVEQDMEQMGFSLEEKIVRYRIVTEPHSFYSITPGTERLRPEQKTPIAGLALAGDYTKQGFLSSMEGAVISGIRAAEALM